MRPARDYSQYEKVIVANSVERCLLCGGATAFAYRSDRHLAFLKSAQHLFYDVRRCGTATCPAYFPEAVTLHALPKREYGLEVIAWIGNRRVRQALTFEQIGTQLRQEHRIEISDREVEDLFGVYLALLNPPIEKDPKRQESLRQQRRIILSIDAAQPEADGEALWLLRDYLSGEILRGFSCLSIDAEGIAREIEEVKKLGIPIVGVISDAQNILVEGVKKALPGVPHQLCQIHFLKDMAKVVNHADRALQEDLKKQLKGLRTFERAAGENGAARASGKPIFAPPTLRREPQGNAQPQGPGRPTTRVVLQPPLNAQEAHLVRELCELIRAVLKMPGRYPLDAPGVQAYENVHTVLRLLQEELPQKRGLDCSLSYASICR